MPKPRPHRQRRARKRVHDLRHLYGSIPGKANLVAMTIDEPGGLLSSDAATREIGRRRNGTLAHPRGEYEWRPPERPTVIVAQSVRNDPLGQMYARRQIDYVRYMAGRGYQELYEIAQAGRYGSSDPARTASKSGGNRTDGAAIDRQARAARTLRRIDTMVRRDMGMHGLMLTRSVLIGRKAAGFGARTKDEKHIASSVFRCCLTLAAIALGFATVSIKAEDRAEKRKLQEAHA